MSKIYPDKSVNTIENFDHYLYKIGLLLTPIRPEIRRSLVYNPIIISLTLITVLFERLLSLFVNNQVYLAILGEFGHFFGIKIQWSLMISLLCLFGLSSQLIYFVNYYRGIYPTYLGVFQVLSSSNDSSDMMNIEHKTILLKITRKLSKIVDKFCKLVFILTFFITLMPWVLYGSTIEIIYCLTLNAMVTAASAHYVWNYLLYQYFYFYIICKYLNLKLYSLNKRLILMRRHNRFKQIDGIITEFVQIYREINDYNSTYFSKFLFSFCFVLSLGTIVFLYVTMFLSLLLVMRITLIYFVILDCAIFLFTIMTASSITKPKYHISYSTVYFVNYHLILTLKSANENICSR